MCKIKLYIVYNTLTKTIEVEMVVETANGSSLTTFYYDNVKKFMDNIHKEIELCTKQ